MIKFIINNCTEYFDDFDDFDITNEKKELYDKS